MGKITTAVFEPGSTIANVYGLWQYDYGQTLRIQGLHLSSAVEIHFSLQETGGASVSRVGVTKDGVTDVIIPDSMLENDGATRDYDMFAMIKSQKSEIELLKSEIKEIKNMIKENKNA